MFLLNIFDWFVECLQCVISSLYPIQTHYKYICCVCVCIYLHYIVFTLILHVANSFVFIKRLHIFDVTFHLIKFTQKIMFSNSFSFFFFFVYFAWDIHNQINLHTLFALAFPNQTNFMIEISWSPITHFIWMLILFYSNKFQTIIICTHESTNCIWMTKPHFLELRIVHLRVMKKISWWKRADFQEKAIRNALSPVQCKQMLKSNELKWMKWMNESIDLHTVSTLKRGDDEIWHESNWARDTRTITITTRNTIR